jgi:branched-subunit amino acid aminotransferase/4-amino-4-deoxychorismate lyase
MSPTTLYRFLAGGLEPVTWCQPEPSRVLVADSWRVEDGRAVAMDRHLERFTSSVHRQSPEANSHLDAFLAAVTRIIPPSGHWFPRLECVDTPDGPEFRFYERAAPARLTEVILADTSEDPRTDPLTKGPDLEALLALRRSVANVGATEAVIVDSAGRVIEGAYSSIVVFPPDLNALWVVAPQFPRIPSVTESVITDIAREHGLPVVEQDILWSSLGGHEVWALSALHGIRRATQLVGLSDPPAVSALAEAWQGKWWARAQRVNP